MKARRRIGLSAMALGLPFATATCGGSSGPAPSDCGYMDDPQARWEHCGLASYTAVEQRICFCPALKSWTVVVRDGVIVDAIPDPAAPGDPDALRREAMSRAWTVEQMFARIAADGLRAERMDARYNEARGFPEQVFVDFRLLAADDEILYRMLDLAPGMTPPPDP